MQIVKQLNPINTTIYIEFDMIIDVDFGLLRYVGLEFADDLLNHYDELPSELNSSTVKLGTLKIGGYVDMEVRNPNTKKCFKNDFTQNQNAALTSGINAKGQSQVYVGGNANLERISSNSKLHSLC